MYFLILFFFFFHEVSFAATYKTAHHMLEQVLVSARAQNILPPLAQNFCRIITQGQDAFNQTNHVNFNTFMYKHYTERWNTNCSVKIWHNSIKSIHNSPLEIFHQTVAERFTKRTIRKCTTIAPESFIISPKDLDEENILSLNEHHLFKRDTFVDGHQILLSTYKIPFPLIVAAFFDKERAKNNYYRLLPTNTLKKHKTHNWFVPLEQALLMTKKQHILSRLALLEGSYDIGGWGVQYTGTAIGLIPANTIITASIGLVGSQSYRDLTKMNGGATQIFIAQAERMEFIDIDVVNNDTLDFIKPLHALGLFDTDNGEIKAFSDIVAAFDHYPY